MRGIGHAQPQRRITLRAVEAGGGFGKAAANPRHIPQIDLFGAARGADDQPLQLADILKLAGGVQANGLAAHQHAAGVRHHVLVAQQVIDGLRRDAQRSHAGAGDFQVHFFLGYAGQVDLANALDQHQLAAQVVGVIAQFAVVVTVTADHEEGAEHVAKIIHDLRLAHARRQVGAQVIDAAAHLVPDLRQLLGAVLRLHLDHDLRQAGAAGRGNGIDVRQLLDSVLQRVGQFLFHLLRRGAGVGRDDHGHFQGKGRIFQPPQIDKGDHAANAEQQRDQPAGHPTLDKVRGNIHYSPRSRTQRRTCWPSLSSLPPAATICSPASSPLSTSMPSWVSSPTVTLRALTCSSPSCSLITHT